MLFHLIIKGLSATAGGVGRESADRIAARNNRESILCNSVPEETEGWVPAASVWQDCAKTAETELRL
jgi:hypothetical protein